MEFFIYKCRGQCNKQSNDSKGGAMLLLLTSGTKTERGAYSNAPHLNNEDCT